MRTILRGFNFICYCFYSIMAKFLWGKALKVDGLFHKKLNTQIIISNEGKMVLKKDVNFQKNVSLTATGGGTLSIGENATFNRNCIVICRNKITIEDNVIFGPGVTIYDHDHIFSTKGIEKGFKLGEVVIGKGCWIAANVVILRNIHIGEGCVIGAGCIVKGDIPPHSLVKGNRGLSILPIKDVDQGKVKNDGANKL